MAQRVLQHRLSRSGTGLLAGILLAGIAGGASIAAPVWADGPHPRRNDEYKHQVEKLEETWRAAQLGGDVATMDKLLSDDYVGITMNGQVVTKMQQLDRMRNREIVLTKIVLDDVKVKVMGSTAIVQSRADVEGTDGGEPIHGNYRYTRVYSRQPTGTWKITNFQATRIGMPGGPGGPGGPPPGRHPPPRPSTPN